MIEAKYHDWATGDAGHPDGTVTLPVSLLLTLHSDGSCGVDLVSDATGLRVMGSGRKSALEALARDAIEDAAVRAAVEAAGK